MALFALVSLAVVVVSPGLIQVPAEPATPSYQVRGEVKLKQVRAFYLKTPAGLKDAKDFAFADAFPGDLDANGRFVGTMPDIAQNVWEVVLVDANGSARKIPTNISNDSGLLIDHALLTGANSALLIGQQIDKRSAAFWTIDLESGKAQRIWEDLKREPASQVVRLSDGNFVVHSELGIDVLTPSGTPIWTEKLSNESPFTAPYRLPMTLAGIGALPGNRVAVCDVFSRTVTVFDEKGKLLNTIHLQEPPKGESILNYDSFVVDEDGSFWSCDQNIVSHFDAKGTFLNSGRIRCSDGYLASINQIPMGGTWMLPDKGGHIWISDGNGLFLCQDDGKVIATRGPDPTKQAMGPTTSFTFDSNGDILCIDSRTRSIHKFAYTGKYLGVASDALRTEDDLGSLVNIDGTPNGRMFIESMMNARNILVIGPDGTITNRVKLTATGERQLGDTFRPTEFKPVPESWRNENGDVVRPLTDVDGKLVYRFDKTTRDFRGWFAGANYSRLFLYDPKGKCMGTIDGSKAQQPFMNLAYNGKIVVGLAPFAGLCAFSPKGDLLWTVANSIDGGEVWYDFALSPDGKEIAILGADNLVTFYALP